MEETTDGDVSGPATPVPLTAEAFAATYTERVHRFAVLVSPRTSDPDDLAQEALARVLARLDRYDPRRGAMEAWLWQIVLNLARDAGRAAGRSELLLGRLALHHGSGRAEASAESVALRRLEDDALVDAVRRLPRRYRTVIALRFGAGLRATEAAEVLGTTRMSVVHATRRALDRLRPLVEEEA